MSSIQSDEKNIKTAPRRFPRAIKSIDKRTIELLGQADRGEITIKAALTQIGIAERQAAKGWTLVKMRRSLREALAAAKSEELLQLRPDEARQTEANQDAELINWRLRENIRAGEDKAHQSCKLLGSRKDLNMWTPDNIAGVVVINAPNVPATDSLPVLEADCG